MRRAQERARSAQRTQIRGYRLIYLKYTINKPQSGRLGSTPRYTPPGTHLTAPPRVPTDPPTATAHCRLPGSGTLGTCTYDRFGMDQGDPRGG